MRIRQASSSFFSTALVACHLANIFGAVQASFAPPVDDEQQCTGYHLDYDRLTAVTPDEINMAAPNPEAMFGDKTYDVNSILPVTDHDTNECVIQRHRLQQTVCGVPVLGAEAIVTVEDCSPPDQTAFGGGYFASALSGIAMGSISAFEGKTYTLIDESTGCVPTVTEPEATAALAAHFETPADKVGDLSTVIFPSFEKGDFLAYRSEVWVSNDGDIQLYDVFISAHDLEILQTCKKINRQRIERRRNLREQVEADQNTNRDLRTICGSCANQAKVTWTNEEVECPINSLYLNDSGRNATCLKGTVDGRDVLGPGTVAGLHYAGTYDCNSREDVCNANELPICSDALSDVHYGIQQSLKFNQDYIGVMGGLKVSATSPQKFSSFVHFSNQYCNAFFTSQTNSLYFGDCDCETWSPLTSLDVAAHELAHGVTIFSSALIYSHQPGGLNEGYSDIMGATMEYYVNDSNDTPDFNLGENLIGDGMSGAVLRYMENPTQDGKSIADVCDFRSNTNVHHSSGVLNKAFTSAVRSCQSSGCSGERDCVLLLGPLFMYANIHKLTALSGYLDSASQTCGVVDEFYATRSPSTECSTTQAKQFVADGWAGAGVTINTSSCGATTTSGCVIPGTPASAGGTINCLTRVRAGFAVVFSWLAGPFAN